MRALRFHHAGPIDPGPTSPPGTPEHPGSAPAPAGRLNLLLSCGTWQDDPWVDRLPRMLEPMGVQALRAQTGREATRVIDRSPVHVAVVDLALPMHDDPAEQAGVQLLDLLRRLRQPPPTVVIKRARSARDDRRELAAALRAGAFAVIDRPHDTTDLERMLEILRRIVQRHYQGRWPAT
ncbi:MAG: response regulator [Planctomycetota bacterium]